MNNWGKEKIDPSNNIAPQTWKNYFQGLLNNKSIKKVDIPQGEQFNTFEPILDRRINKEEIKNGLDHLKSGKAPGPDGILTEYLKAFARVSENTLLKMIRDIFSNHVYPSKWACNFLKPIYKKKDVKLPDNYRGLAILSILAKLFSFILFNRLNKYIEERNIISPNQIGFMKGYRTSDHIFLLQTIIEKVVKKSCNQKLFYFLFKDYLF